MVILRLLDFSAVEELVEQHNMQMLRSFFYPSALSFSTLLHYKIAYHAKLTFRGSVIFWRAASVYYH